MNVELHQILGTWRYANGNILIDFNIRQVNHGENGSRAMFTIYQREPENKIHYEWHGEVEILNSENNLPEIVISNIVKTEEKPEYENLKIWMFNVPGEMYIELGNGDRILFNKLGNVFS